MVKDYKRFRLEVKNVCVRKTARSAIASIKLRESKRKGNDKN